MLCEVFDFVEVILQLLLDILCLLWMVILVEGMVDGRVVMLLYVSYVVIDGVGGVEMFVQIYDFECDLLFRLMLL